MNPRKVYLSRLLLDMKSPQVLAELAHPYEMHRTLMRAFPRAMRTAEARKEHGVLFRAETDTQRSVAKVYVQSLVEPDWSNLQNPEGYFCWFAGASAYECKEVGRALASVRPGQVLAFRLRANPTKRLARDGDPLKGKRVELQKEHEQLDWLVSKGRGGREGVPGGFELVALPTVDAGGRDRLIPRVQVRNEGKLTGVKKTSDGGHAMRHLSVVFDGLLRVTDPEAFFETVCRGVGSAKAYGFGLLTVAPAAALRSGATS